MGVTLAKTPRMTPERFRALLEQRGPIFIKLGQFLALRPDLIPQSYCNELLGLLDAVAPEPFATSRKIVESDLGQPFAELFELANPAPVAAASLAQVFRARTHSGRDVAIKVQRLDIRETAHRDLARIRRLAPALDAIGMSPVVTAVEIQREFERWLTDELDLEVELRNLRRLHQRFATSNTVTIPEPVLSLCGPRVLTADYLEGVPFTELLRALRGGDTQVAERLGFDRARLASRFYRAVLQQIFEFEFFHADTHPGNILALPGNRIGFVDFGLVDRIDVIFKNGLLRYVSAVYNENVEDILQGLEEVLQAGDNADRDGFRRDVLDEARIWLREKERQTGARATGQRPISRFMIGVLRAARNNGMRVPPSILSMYRALLTTETVATELYPAIDLDELGSDFFARLQVDIVLRELQPDNVRYELLNAATDLRDNPKRLNRLLSEVADGRFVLNVQSKASPADRRRADTRAKLVCVAILALSLTVLLSGQQDYRLFGLIAVSGVLWVLLGLALAWLLLLYRRLR